MNKKSFIQLTVGGTKVDNGSCNASPSYLTKELFFLLFLSKKSLFPDILGSNLRPETSYQLLKTIIFDRGS